MQSFKLAFQRFAWMGMISGTMLVLGISTSGCAKVHKIEDGRATIAVANGEIVIDQGRYHFGPKKRNPKDKIVSEYSRHACYFKFRIGNFTDRVLQIKTMGYLLDKAGNNLETVMTSYYQRLKPGEYKLIEGFFGVKKKDVSETARFKIMVDDVHAE